MIAALLFAGLVGVLEASPTLSIPIESCDGSSKGYFTRHADGEQWFSLAGRVLDAGGKPVCGAWVVAEYLNSGRTEARDAGGPVSPTGRNGEFFLHNIHKGAPFRLRVNPYQLLELRARTEGLASLASFARLQENVRIGGVLRYESEELKSTSRSGTMSFDVKLEENAAATGILAGSVGIPGPYDVESPARARMFCGDQEPIEVSVDRRTGEFIIFGVPTGQHRVDVEVSTNKMHHALTKTVIVPAGKNSVTRVELLKK